jgi:hypothetical protein
MEGCRRYLSQAQASMRYNIFSFLKMEELWDFMVAVGIPT